MRRSFGLLLLLLPLFAFAQPVAFQGESFWDAAGRSIHDTIKLSKGSSMFKVTKPQITVTIYKHRTGADMVEIAATDANYPPELLAKQVNQLGIYLNSAPRGLDVQRHQLGDNALLQFVKAQFAVNNIIDRDKGVLNLTPIVRAFAGAPAPYTVRALEIIFNGEKPTANTISSYAEDKLRLQATAQSNPDVIEYRIELLSQNPDELKVPDAPEQKAEATASTEQRNGVDWTLWITLGIAAVAAGVLVYFLLLRASAKSRR